MKVLADTSVWLLALRRRESAAFKPYEQRLKHLLAEGISDGRVVLIGPIRQEVLSGIKDEAQFRKLKEALQAFRDEPVENADYERAARDYSLCRSKGLHCGPIDILICSLAHQRKWQVLTADETIIRCIEILGSGATH